MNKCILMGRLTKDPEVRFTQGESPKAVAKFSLAVDRRFKNSNGEQETDFFNCTCFGKTAEFCEKYLRKGTKVLVEGRLQNDNYTNRDGQKVTATGIVLDNLEFCESKKQQEGPKPISDVDKEQWMAAAEMENDELPFNF